MQVKLDTGLVGAMVVLCFACGSADVRADTVVNPSTEYLNRIKGAETIQPLGDTPFGESISLFNGALSFRQTDISYPGIGPSITLTRSYEASGSPLTYGNDLPMGDWDLSIPRIATVVSGNRMGNKGIWTTGAVTVSPEGTTSIARCTGFGEIIHAPYGYGLSWWHGYQLITGDGSSQPLMKRTPSNSLAPGDDVAAYPIVTPGHWMISCLSSTANAPAGEAFLATAPDGTKYWFNHLAYGEPMEMLIEQIPHMNNPDDSLATAPGGEGDGASTPAPTGSDPNVYWGEDEQYLPRKMGYMYATRVEDRFGNWVSYTYDLNNRLTEINASDLRKVVVTWRSDAPLIDRITLQPGSADARIWRYEYSTPTVRETRELIRVIQPDQTAWELMMAATNQLKVPAADPDNRCGVRSFTQVAADDNLALITIAHPSGLIGNFWLSYRAHARSWVPTICAQMNGTLSPWVERRAPVYLSLSITSKTIEGVGVPPATWSYQYSPAAGSSDAECLAAGCRDWKWTEVTDPGLETIHYQFSTRWGYREGKLESTVIGTMARGQDFPSGLQSESLGYADPQLAWNFPTRLGEAMEDSIAFSNTAPTETLSPEVLSQVTRQEVLFSRQTTTFDRFGQPERVVRSNSLGNTRTDTTTYWPADGQWVLGQVWKITQGGKLASQTEYDAKILPQRVYSFGVLTATYGYDASGLLSAITDPLGNVTRVENYHRGVPQLIQFADASIVTPTVDDFGQIRAVKNQLGDSTTYEYDSMGRMTKLGFPAGDSLPWNPVTRKFTLGLVAAYGLPAGHWQQTVETGAARTSTFYDALWRPRLMLTQDTGNTLSKSFVVKRYDEKSREIFSSYPVDALTSVDQALLGVRTTFDALGRVEVVSQDSEQGVLTTISTYLPHFRTRITNPRQFQTTTGFQIFDTPTEQSPIRIEAPEGVTTTIVRDLLGKPLSITREGPAG
ncbi:MAG: hypothetical protein U1A73_15380 [Pseudomonas sp.]|nr:hypothetical protein [Pseudomonas sp.]